MKEPNFVCNIPNKKTSLNGNKYKNEGTKSVLLKEILLIITKFRDATFWNLGLSTFGPI